LNYLPGLIYSIRPFNGYYDNDNIGRRQRTYSNLDIRNCV